MRAIDFNHSLTDASGLGLECSPASRSLIIRSTDIGVLDFIRRRLGLVSPAAALRELANEFVDDGDELVPWALVESAIDDTLGELPSHTGPALTFVDLGRKRDLTSVVTVVMVGLRRPEACDHVPIVSVQTWSPKDSPSGDVDFALVRGAIAQLPRRFPNLRRVLVDEGAEAGSILPWAKAHPALSLRVEGFTGSVGANMYIWSALLARLNGQTLSLPRHERLLSELRGLRREEFAFDSKWRVIDSSRKFHGDVSLTLAGAVMAAGTTAWYPHCTDPDSEWPLPPYGLLGSPRLDAWYARHPDPTQANDEVEIGDEPAAGVFQLEETDAEKRAASRTGGQK